jgi:hypothetical protein
VRPSARYVGPGPRIPEAVPGWDAEMVAPSGYTPSLRESRQTSVRR